MPSRKRTPSWMAAARSLHALKIDAGETCACRTTRNAQELVHKLATIELCYGCKLPPSYREFMLRYDGWSCVLRDASLLSVEQMRNPGLVHLAETAIERANTPVPGAVSTGTSSWRDDNLIPIGLDGRGEILLALDASSVQADGEMDLLVWIAELGIRLPSFGELFGFLCELLEHRIQRNVLSTFAAA